MAVHYMHYSNAGLNSPNPGVDFLSLSCSHAF
ncbi:acyloxyacyl hydrolase [Rheinheimera sp.]